MTNNFASNQLSKEQIEYLFAFTEKKMVRWYDLQIELVDHLASRIEEEMAVNTAPGFDEALTKVYRDFGLFGFAKVVQEKSAALEKTARSTWWRELRLLFRWPAAIGWMLLAACLYQLTVFVPMPYLYYTFLGAYAVFAVFNMLNAYRLLKLKRKLLIVQAGLSYSPASVWIYGVMLFSVSDEISPVAFGIYAFMGVLFQFTTYNVYKKVKGMAVNLYPEAFAG